MRSATQASCRADAPTAGAQRRYFSDQHLFVLFHEPDLCALRSICSPKLGHPRLIYHSCPFFGLQVRCRCHTHLAFFSCSHLPLFSFTMLESLTRFLLYSIVLFLPLPDAHNPLIPSRGFLFHGQILSSQPFPQCTNTPRMHYFEISRRMELLPGNYYTSQRTIVIANAKCPFPGPTHKRPYLPANQYYWGIKNDE